MIAHAHKNKVEYVADRLRRMIRSGELKESMRLASSAEIAREFQVSPVTADRAIRLLVSEGKLKRIPGCGTFLRSGRKVIRIGMMDSYPDNSLFERINLYRKNTYPLLEKEFLKYPAEVHHAETWEEIRNLDPDGILCSEEPPPDLECKVPVALFRRYRLRDVPCIQCVPDLENVMREIFTRFRKRKIRKIYVLATARFPDIRYFADIFLLWAERSGMREKVVYAEERMRKKLVLLPFQNGYQFGMALPEVKGCAIFTTSDFLGSGILKALDDRGFRPGEYDLISCSNWEAYGYAPFPRPRLTSIEFRREECIREVVRLLCDAVISQDREKIKIVKFPAFLKIRESGFFRRRNRKDPPGE